MAPLSSVCFCSGGRVGDSASCSCDRAVSVCAHPRVKRVKAISYSRPSRSQRFGGAPGNGGAVIVVRHDGVIGRGASDGRTSPLWREACRKRR